ncbi:MITOTIC SPINDLE ASSEMBLY CHECKPOINT PROTEIN MAD1 MITOTIC ARREST DEFICIENT-LIKE PROTEIN 1 [Salix koriyanagi]|uniref:MITOTIC SPINDLE ASSEMBLY CHECKPOINT PROTEIN MAD1 MITOTIC ARREST DEFICIENT-LIKE PROTEIN 1 n=1 Tax=Salix koriyanagi TaxID=2511006 RepID=A0A9Q0Q5X3_9ROSI|nr:MITOTIC SPINDLE ASSEMBLY CHECKPOINT PROTEIN MAD1 MITOTIC ARREST DEFICIENT-LIKE PROTEIN 1 [Salix koriyanagi]
MQYLSPRALNWITTVSSSTKTIAFRRSNLAPIILPPPNNSSAPTSAANWLNLILQTCSSEKQARDYQSKLKELNENFSKSEDEKKRFPDKLLQVEQELAAAKGREHALQNQLVKEVNDNQERFLFFLLLLIFGRATHEVVPPLSTILINLDA